MARLRIALSSWFGSQSVGQRPPASDELQRDCLADGAPEQILHGGDELRSR